jgi:hypothetical protein
MLCKVCNEDLHENNFYLKDKETNRRSTICKECYNYKRNRNHSIKQEPKKIPVIKMIPNTCNTNNTINTIEVKQEIKKIPSSMEIKKIPSSMEIKKIPVDVKQKIPSSMNEVLNMVNSKKYNNPYNKNTDIIIYSVIVGLKSLFGTNKKKPVTQVKQEINHNESFGQAMVYDDNYYGYGRIK